MRISRVFLTTHLLILLSSFSLGGHAAESNIKVTSIAEVEVEVVRNGKKELKRIPPEKTVPGTEVIFTNRFENIGGKTASDIVINNPIPAYTEYKADSAFGNDCASVFSTDNGKTFATAENLKVKGADGKEHAALPKQYTHIRWNCQGQLASGKSGEVGFRAVIK